MTNTMNKTEAALLARVATMTADEANALAGVQAKEWRTAQSAADKGLFGPAVTLGRLIHLGVVADGRKKSDEATESFGAWGKRYDYKASTVTLLQTLARMVEHGMTPGSDPEAWRIAVQHGTNKIVREALNKNPGATNSKKARETLVQADTGTLPKSAPRKPKTPDETGDDSGSIRHSITAKNVDTITAALVAWVAEDGNVSAVADEVLVNLAHLFTDAAERCEAEGHRRIAARKTGKKATDKHLAAAV